jgi:hypothetical protein
MASWSLVATVKAPEAKVLAFVAHHLSLGVDHIWIYFDDPDDPTAAALTGHSRITVTLCTADYWAATGKRRPDAHQNRQARNAKDAYRHCTSAWLGHIDVDEFILPDRSIADILETVPPDDILVRMEPFEAMHDATLADDIYTARVFRGAIRHAFWKLRYKALGPYRNLVRDGMLSHTVGKVFFRTGIRHLAPRLHGVVIKQVRLVSPEFNPELRLLHFHAQDREAWLAAIPFRITRGAYQFRPELQAHLTSASPEEIETFYQRTQTMKPHVITAMQAVGRALTTDLGLTAKVQAFKEGRLP